MFGNERVAKVERERHETEVTVVLKCLASPINARVRGNLEEPSNHPRRSNLPNEDRKLVHQFPFVDFLIWDDVDKRSQQIVFSPVKQTCRRD